jgi:hypothetical protein
MTGKLYHRGFCFSFNGFKIYHSKVNLGYVVTSETRFFLLEKCIRKRFNKKNIGDMKQYLMKLEVLFNIP